MSAAPSWPLISSPLMGAPSEARFGIAPGLNFDSFLAPKSKCQDLNPESGHRTFRTQNDARGHNPPPPSTPLIHGLKKPEIAYLPTACVETLPFPPPNRAFVLPHPYGTTIIEIRGATHRIPTHFCVRPPFSSWPA